MPTVSMLDHLVLTVADLQATIRFYEDILGMRAVSFEPADGSTRWALSFGAQKINLHPADGPFDPKAALPAPGSADLCFLSDRDLDEWRQHLQAHEIRIEEGPVRRTGATGPILSLYLRDPDGNLIEVSNALHS
ncbi:VOC family protein [Aliiroseovarius sp. KMU-50]|uniref:VOC family protein n=1 Tax=Aliiroseovarius salicola TaxID=3009082 RepID=A0ABT4W4K2_9RHOB|nr:VOC family protein [Aliiroseovarius sp. KMU-50]MDA5095438.1 VOC family protein [Aliiroseovarius sp. KMU-50]